MPEAFQPTISIYRQPSSKFKKPSINVFLGFAPRTEAKVLINDKLGDGKAVVNHGNVKLLTGVAYPSLLIGLTGRITQGVPGKPVKSRAGMRQQAIERLSQAFYIDRVISEFLSLAGWNQDGCRCTITVATTIKKP